MYTKTSRAGGFVVRRYYFCTREVPTTLFWHPPPANLRAHPPRLPRPPPRQGGQAPLPFSATVPPGRISR